MSSMISFKKITNGILKENCYVFTSKHKEAIIFDPGGDFELIKSYITKNSLKPLAILNTHAHFDHIGAVSQLKKYFSIPFYLHSQDFKLLKSANIYLKFFMEKNFIEIPNVDIFIDDLSCFFLGEFEIKTIFTPGHTNGSVSYIIDNKMICGDIFVENKIGRTDLPGGNKILLLETLTKIKKLPHNLEILPGHGNNSFLSEQVKKIDVFLEENNANKN